MENATELAALSAALGRQLSQRQATLTTAESCTGGWIAKAITDTGGCSAWFSAGLVTYSEQSKQALLGVSAQTLAQYGVVSEQVAQEMATGVLHKIGADYAISVTGFAGPGGGTDLLPVGTVCFGFATAEGGVCSFQRHFAGDREQVRYQAVLFALHTALATFFQN